MASFDWRKLSRPITFSADCGYRDRGARASLALL